MDTLTFVSHLVDSLAWPVATIVGLALFRKVVLNLVPLIRTLRYSDLELNFGRELAGVRQAADAAAIIPKDRAKVTQPWEDLVRLASARPRSAIRQAWQQVEATLHETAKAHSIQAAPGVWSMPMVLGSLMLNAGVMSDPQYDLLNHLRRLTSEAERAPIDSLSTDDAIEFIGLALRLAGSLKNDA